MLRLIVTTILTIIRNILSNEKEINYYEDYTPTHEDFEFEQYAYEVNDSEPDYDEHEEYSMTMKDWNSI